MTQEMIDEIVDKNEVENYCTEYDNHYYKDGFDPSESHGPNEEVSCIDSKMGNKATPVFLGG